MMKLHANRVSHSLTVALLLGVLSSPFSFGAAPSEYRSEAVAEASHCILDRVSEMMAVPLPPEIELPRIRLSNEVSLAEFQDAVEPQWGFRPEVILNVYIADRNEIFLRAGGNAYLDDRSLFDSLAHEFVHFIQVKVMRVSLEDAGEFEESEAIRIQTAFRETWGGLAQGTRFDCTKLRSVE